MPRGLLMMIPWALMLGIVVISGCGPKPCIAPELRPPPRPQLTPLTAEQWNTVPAEVRDILSGNQVEIHRYVLQLELLAKKYDEWRQANSE